jgi:hypothetical protein
MYRKILVGGVTAVAILGAGTAALATTGSDTTSGTPAASSSSAAAANHAKAKHGKGKHSPLRHAAHARITVKTKKGYVTRDLINGTVTAVSTTSITVQAGDKTTETFVVGKATKVVARAATKGAKPTASSIGKVTKGQHVIVTGVGTSKPAAKHIVDLGTK